MTTFGVDVARGGEDRTVVAIREGNAVLPLVYGSQLDTMATTGRVAALAERYRPARIVVDVVGVGAGVYDRLRELGFPVVPFHAGERTEMRDRSGELGFVNKRSAAWWTFREMLEPGSGFGIALPPDDVLVGDLTAPRWRIQSGGRIQVEAKDEIRKRLGRSTDAADAVVQAFWEEPILPMAAKGARVNPNAGLLRW